MKPLIQYSLPVKGLRKGTHQFDFQIDSAFFEHFEGAPVSDGNIELTLLFDKRPNLYVLDFQFSGTLKTECDRCLAWIDLPVSGEPRLMVKFSTEADRESEEADVVYIDPETGEFVQQPPAGAIAAEPQAVTAPPTGIQETEHPDGSADAVVGDRFHSYATAHFDENGTLVLGCSSHAPGSPHPGAGQGTE